MVKSSLPTLKVGSLYRLRNESKGPRTPCFSVVTRYKLALGDGTLVDYDSAAAKFFVPGQTVLYLGQAEGYLSWKLRNIFVHEFLIDQKVCKILSVFSYGGRDTDFERFEDAFELIADAP